MSIKGHKFNVKKYLALPFGRGGKMITGRISHHLGGARRDDQLDYTVQFKQYDAENKTLAMIKVTKTEGGNTKFLAPIISAIGTYYTGVPIPTQAVRALGRALGRAVDGTEWESVANYLIGEIAIHA